MRYGLDENVNDSISYIHRTDCSSQTHILAPLLSAEKLFSTCFNKNAKLTKNEFPSLNNTPRYFNFKV
jgi:hypothetical protein